jgi:hypothetical protein
MEEEKKCHYIQSIDSWVSEFTQPTLADWYVHGTGLQGKKAEQNDKVLSLPELTLHKDKDNKPNSPF